MILLLEESLLVGHTNIYEIQVVLEQARKYPTGQIWIDCLVIPVMIAHMYVYAEKGERNYIYQRYCLKRMVTYFIAAGHFSYGRYILWRVKEQESIQEEAEVLWLLGGLSPYDWIVEWGVIKSIW